MIRPCMGRWSWTCEKDVSADKNCARAAPAAEDRAGEKPAQI
jgi:hypothetical protein